MDEATSAERCFKGKGKKLLLGRLRRPGNVRSVLCFRSVRASRVDREWCGGGAGSTSGTGAGKVLFSCQDNIGSAVAKQGLCNGRVHEKHTPTRQNWQGMDTLRFVICLFRLGARKGAYVALVHQREFDIRTLGCIRRMGWTR